jgi:hypothetical protein
VVRRRIEVGALDQHGMVLLKPVEQQLMNVEVQLDARPQCLGVVTLTSS